MIIMTAYGDPDGAELAIANGAWDYLQKPPSIDQFQLALERAVQYPQAETSGCIAPHSGTVRASWVKAQAINECMKLVGKAAPTEAPVLITGDTGTGKELFARALHKNSNRSTAPFVVVDCASLPENLVESVLFGHGERGFYRSPPLFGGFGGPSQWRHHFSG